MTWSVISWDRVSATLIGYVVVMVTVVNMGEVRNCNDTQKSCLTQMGCSVAIHNYLTHCSPIIQGETNECTYHCKSALLSLLSTESHAGLDINTCDCQGSEFCILSRTKLQVCHDEVMASIDQITDQNTPLSCSLALMICSADTSCLTALNYYDQHCRKLVKGEKCTSRCNNSLSILYRQPKAFKLRNCICDGHENYDCPTLRHNTETLCFGDRRQRQRHKLESTTQRIHHLHHHNHTRSPHHHKNNKPKEGENSGDNIVDKTVIPEGSIGKDPNKLPQIANDRGGAGNLNQNVHFNVYLALSSLVGFVFSGCSL